MGDLFTGFPSLENLLAPSTHRDHGSTFLGLRIASYLYLGSKPAGLHYNFQKYLGPQRIEALCGFEAKTVGIQKPPFKDSPA